MKKRTKKLLSLLLAFTMVGSMAACGKKGDTETKKEETTGKTEQQTEGDFTVSYDDEEIYMNALGDFYEIYQEALEAETVSERYALMAAAEAKILESGVGFPMYTSGSSYMMTRLAYRTGGYSLWSGETMELSRYLITNEPIKSADYNHLREMWNELSGTGTYTESAKSYLTEQGYTFADHYDVTFDDLGQTWDIHAASGNVDTKFIDPTIDYLFRYGSEAELEPRLAESYEVSADGLTYTFKIRKGVTWTDSQGRKVADLTADDWVASAQHMADTVSSSTEDFSGVVEGYAEYVSGETTDFSTVGIKALDDYTLQYSLIEPCPYFLSMLQNSSFLPMSRSYYTSQGGVFGLAEYEAASMSASYSYGLDQDHIAYCGPFLCTNVTEKNSVTFVANENYWDAANTKVKKLNWTYDDGTDTTRAYTNFWNGITTTLSMRTAQLETAKSDGYFDDYAIISDNGTNTFMLWFNQHRQVYANVADGASVSPKTDEQKEETYAALQNQHFRLAIAHAFDRATYVEQNLGSDMKYACLRSGIVPGTFVALEEDTTIEVGGESFSYEAGTYYGAIVQSQLDADGYNVKVWNEENLTGDGFDGWYNPEEAMKELEIAIAELKSIGIEVSEENPITIDHPYVSYSEAGANQGYVLKRSIEESLNGLVQVNLIECNDSNEYRNTEFNTQNGSEHNDDLGGSGGVGADYGDPACYLEMLQPYGDGYATPKMGLW